MTILSIEDKKCTKSLETILNHWVITDSHLKQLPRSSPAPLWLIDWAWNDCKTFPGIFRVVLKTHCLRSFLGSPNSQIEDSLQKKGFLIFFFIGSICLRATLKHVRTWKQYFSNMQLFSLYESHKSSREFFCRVCEHWNSHLWETLIEVGRVDIYI